MLNFSRLITRIKKNEGYSNVVYKDQLGFFTIGYGHLITTKDSFSRKKKYSKKTLNKVFYKDLKAAISEYKKNYHLSYFPQTVQEVIIEMIFQLGIDGVLKFKKFNSHIKKKHFYIAAFEMMKSLWFKQTPNRVNILISILLKNVRKKRR